MRKSAITISLLIMLCQIVLFAKADPNNNIKSQAQLDAQLLEAIKKTEPNEIKVALEKGANPNYISDTPRKFSAITTLLWFPTSNIRLAKEDRENRCFQCLNLLFNAGGKLQPCDQDVLFMPISNGFPKTVELLIKKGANPKTKMEGMTPVEWAAAHGEQPVVEMLLKYGAKPITKEQTAQNRFVLLDSRFFEENAIPEMEKALQNGASVDTPDSRGEIALANAIICAYDLRAYAMACYLLQKGANPNLKAERQEFSGLADIPLNHAVEYHGLMVGKGDYEAVYQKLIIEALLNAGAHVSSRGLHGMSPLHIAAKNNDTYMANVLIKAGAKIMDKDDSGKTPLDYAESGEMIKFLKSHGAKEQ